MADINQLLLVLDSDNQANSLRAQLSKVSSIEDTSKVIFRVILRVLSSSRETLLLVLSHPKDQLEVFNRVNSLKVKWVLALSKVHTVQWVLVHNKVLKAIWAPVHNKVLKAIWVLVQWVLVLNKAPMVLALNRVQWVLVLSKVLVLWVLDLADLVQFLLDLKVNSQVVLRVLLLDNSLLAILKDLNKVNSQVVLRVLLLDNSLLVILKDLNKDNSLLALKDLNKDNSYPDHKDLNKVLVLLKDNSVLVLKALDKADLNSNNIKLLKDSSDPDPKDPDLADLKM